ncbi:hypothetical protein CMV_003748 [Castanea mollissima]|uniref:Pentatricopeptide repeat-containing protein n=1 Tax=Castanea mollissima TaxID=60419 RepID=A0A8J4RZA4_9ROSI|nr:hypothetical protein CMV_003748 [Castanea mollissima]
MRELGMLKRLRSVLGSVWYWTMWFGVLLWLICGYVWNGEFEKGKVVFVEMRGLGLELNEFSLTRVLGALFDAIEGEQVHGIGFKMGPRLLISGRQVQALGQKVGFLKVICVSNALMSMYERCGGMYDARHVIDDMLHRVSVSWNSLTAGYSENGFSSQALEVFSQMRDISLQPNEYALASVLEVVSNLNSMKQKRYCHADAFVLKAFGAMTDLVQGRVVHSLCLKFGVDQDAFVESTVIDMYPCNIHGNVVLGNVAAIKLLELPPENESAYLLLPNLYASAGVLVISRGSKEHRDY